MVGKFQSLYLQLRDDIQRGEYPAGSKLPSESEFCAQLKISRGTLRKALELLAEDGLIHSVHGKGVYVLAANTIVFSFGSLVSFAEVNHSNQLNFVTDVTAFTELQPDVALSQLSGFNQTQTLQKIQRVRKLDNERIIFDLNYFASGLISGLTPAIASNSIYNYIEEQLHLKIGFARRTIQVEMASALDKQNLDLQAFDLVVVVRNWVHLNDGQLFEYTESRHRPDRFVFTEFVRRR